MAKNPDTVGGKPSSGNADCFANRSAVFASAASSQHSFNPHPAAPSVVMATASVPTDSAAAAASATEDQIVRCLAGAQSSTHRKRETYIVRCGRRIDQRVELDPQRSANSIQ